MSILENSRFKLTYEDYVAFPEDGQRHEIVDGSHCVTPSPSSYHQSLIVRLCYQLYEKVERRGKGRVLAAPMDVLLTPVDIVQPDVLVVLEPRTAEIKEKNVQCAPDLIIEVLSAATATRDRQLKKSLYERTGVGEYWIVDPDAKAVEQHVRAESGRPYELKGIAGDRLIATALPDVCVNLNEVW